MDIPKLFTHQPPLLTQEQKENVRRFINNNLMFAAFATAAQEVVNRSIEQSAHADILDPKVAQQVLRMQGKRIGILEFFEALKELVETEEEEITADAER